jgi:intracellular multiplication protein IcmK
LLSPGWSASAKSADGTTVYVVNNTPVFLLSDRGKMVRAVVEENRDEQP